MQAYAEVVPPTAISHAVSLPFTGPKSSNLIVAKTSLLQIFEVQSLPVSSSSRWVDSVQNGASSGTAASESKLVHVVEYPIAGNITSLAGVKLQSSKAGGYGLLVAVKDAKFSLVEWDPEVHGLSTTSIHYYEGEGLQGSPWTPAPSHFSSYLTVDPSYRCAALKFGQRHLAILPFHQQEDLDLDDYDAELDGPREQLARKSSTDEASAKQKTPYGASFVLQLTALDPAILNPIHSAFLHEYREPTLGVLYATRAPSAGLEAERKDAITFAAFTFDIEQRARTPLQSIAGLPSDIFTMIPLALPIGGTLLVGTNELVHIDQSGKVYAVAVNAFAKEQSALPMSDQSHLNLKLENSVVHALPAAADSLVMVLKTGQLALVRFLMDGRTVSSLSINQVPAERGGMCVGYGASCTTTLSSDLLFLGSQSADSVLLHCRSKKPTLSRKRSHAEMMDAQDDEFSDEDMEDEDDLYGGEDALKKTVSSSTKASSADISFAIADRLDTLVPIGDVVLATRKRRKPSNDDFEHSGPKQSLQLVLPTGCGDSGGLSFISQQVSLEHGKSLQVSNCKETWCFSVSGKTSSNILITTHTLEASVKSSVFHVTASGSLEPFPESDFEVDAETLFAGTLAGGKRVVQISSSEVRTYDADMKLSQILAMEDENTDAELYVVNASFLDPYLLVFRNDRSVAVFKSDGEGEIEEQDKQSSLASKQWVSGSMHLWSREGSEASLFLLSDKGGLHIFDASQLSAPIYVAEDLCQLPAVLTQEQAFRKAANPEALTDLLVADIGNGRLSTPHLVVRNELGDVEVYQPFHSNGTNISKIDTSFLRWLRTPCAVSGDYDEASEEYEQSKRGRLKFLSSIGDYNAIFVPGLRPALLLKESSSELRALGLAEDTVQDVSIFHTEAHPQNLLLTTASGKVHIAQLPSHTTYGAIGWSLRRVPLHAEVEAVAFHPPTSLYVVSTTASVPMPDEVYHHWTHENNDALRPQVLQSDLKLIHSDTWVPTYEYKFANHCEHIVCLKAISMETSQSTHERKTFVVAGTAMDRGEDLPCLGGLYLFDIIEVAPDPNHPHPHTTTRKMKLVAHEEFRGPVTAVAEAGNQGLLMAAQGQKILVRGLREDLPGQLLPVAFLDVACYVSSLKNLKGTGLSLIADALKGIQLAGFEVSLRFLAHFSHRF